MQPYRPNKVSRHARIALALCTMLLLLILLAELAIGYTYLPTKRGGLLVTGIPTLSIAASLAALSASCLLMIIDHYDTRPNEQTYKAARSALLKAALWLFLAAPILQIAISALELAGIVIPPFRGFAHHYTWYAPELSEYLRYVAPVLDQGRAIGLVSVLLCAGGLLLNKISPSHWKRAKGMLLGVGLLGFSILVLANTTKNFLSGEVGVGRRVHQEVVRADSEPAKFNAILLTYFGVGGGLLVASIASIIGSALVEPSRQRGK